MARDGPLEAGDPRHGSTSGYKNHGCRCDVCREAWRRRHLEYMARSPEQREAHRRRRRVRWRALGR